ncbi:unnamed protein product [Orchesella dallaii]|uniref:Uncharacterized protein n=1 Tax=Orchesella dallaii TaxID=48710 RepID=A0ABP1QXI1_9HEXA
MKVRAKKFTKFAQDSATDPKNMCRLQLGKIKAEFFSDKGNNLLKRIWLDNNLDEEMIFSSWIGPSQALVRQKVSDYIQAFLIRRSGFVPTHNINIVSKLRRYSTYNELSENGQEKNQYYENYIKIRHQKSSEARENAENLRIINSIANGDLPALPGFEFVVQHPIFKAHEIEQRMKKLNKIPIPYNQSEFEQHILPILTAFKIADELNYSELKIISKSNSFKSSPEQSSSGFSEDDEDGIEETLQKTDSELIQVFSDLDLNPPDIIGTEMDMDETLADICDVCSGLLSNEPDEDLSCTCISDPVWHGRKHSTASALYKDASQIVDLYIREHLVSAEFMEQFNFKTWLD